MVILVLHAINFIFISTIELRKNSLLVFLALDKNLFERKLHVLVWVSLDVIIPSWS